MARAATTTDVFNAVGDRSRRMILDRLGGGEATVGELTAALGFDQPLVSKHLAVLRTVGLVRCRRVGRTRRYRMNATGLDPLREWLDRLTLEVNAHYDRLDDYLAELQDSDERS
jgi:DNA-binding transcriptional ArsR family regulator